MMNFRGIPLTLFIFISLQAYFGNSFKNERRNHISTTSKPVYEGGNTHQNVTLASVVVQVPHEQNNVTTGEHLRELNKESFTETLDEESVTKKLNEESQTKELNEERVTIETDMMEGNITERITREMARYCPSANVCNDNERGRMSCCRSCSCDKACGERMDCCFPFLDTSKLVHKNKLTCIKPVQQPLHHLMKYVQSYYMVDKCLSDETINCKESEPMQWDSVIPVYAQSTGMIYYNKKCAACNGISEVEEWVVLATCNPPKVLTPDVLIKDLHNESCEIEFAAPEEVDIDKYKCYDNIIDSCNMTGRWLEDDPFLREACESVYAPAFSHGFFFSTTTKIYANVFCKLCDGEPHFPEETCPELSSAWSRSLSGTTLTSVIAWDEVRNSRTSVEEVDTSKQCPEFKVKHPNKAEYRPIICPVGSVRSNDGCKIYATTWFSTGYNIHFELSPFSKERLPLSAFNNLTPKQKRNIKSWFDSKGILLDSFKLYTEIVKINNISYTGKLNLIAGREETIINASKTLSTIRLALSQRWEIRLNGKRFLYDVKLDNFSSFVFDGTQRRGSPSLFNKTDLSHAEAESVPPPQRYHLVVDRISPRNNDFFITQMFLCKQVKLLPEEWVGLWREEIQLNLAGNGSGKILGDGQFSVFESQDRKLGVSICVEDFNPLYCYRGGTAAGSRISFCIYWTVFMLLLGLLHRP